MRAIPPHRLQPPGVDDASWLSFWSRPSRVHVSDRHLMARYRAVAQEFLSAFPQTAGRRLLDYGCGEALCAPQFAAAGLEVMLYDRSEWFRERVERRFAGRQGIQVLDTAALAGLPDGSIDYMLVCSVIQYLEWSELLALVDQARHLLRPGGRLILADVIPRELDTVADTLDFLHYSARNRFLLSGLRTLLDMVSSDYAARLRQHQLTRYDLHDLARVLAERGFVEPSVIRRNIGISRARKTMVATRAAEVELVNGSGPAAAYERQSR